MEKYNNWTVLEYMKKNKNEHQKVLCRCSCGTEKIVTLKTIRRGESKSCGCYRNTLYKKNKFGKGNPQWKGGKVLNSQGYVEIRYNNSYVKEHRYVYEQHYGIKLLPHQNVHHINGNRTDNRIGNLELWDTSQPKGQRVEDKIDYYFKLINEYRDHPLYKELISKHDPLFRNGVEI